MNACPACGTADSEILFTARDTLYRTTDRDFSVVECRTCRLLRLSPRPSPDELQQYYPPDYWHVREQEAASPAHDFLRRFLLRDRVRFVQRAVERAGLTGPVLDVGCGGGLLLRMLRERGFQGIGLDFAISAAAAAWEANNVPAVCARLTSSPLAKGSLAAVSMFHVLEHLYEPASYLEAAHELLQPEGRLIVQCPNAGSWQFLLLGAGWRGLDVPRHIWNFRAKDLEILLDRSGFQVVRTKHFSLSDNPAFLATSLAPNLDPDVRRVRGVSETPRRKLWSDILYGALAVASLPVTVLEAACHAGCTVMMEARKKS